MRFIPFEHLFQHIKQSDVRLYEALKKVSLTINDISNVVNEGVPLEGFEKATFGIVQDFEIADDLANHYNIIEPGEFLDVSFNVKNPGDTDMQFDVKITYDTADPPTVWDSIFTEPLTIPGGSAKKYRLGAESGIFVKPTIQDIVRIQEVGMLRCDCLQRGTATAGNGFEVAIRWKVKLPK